jgi:hypothetical protein
VYFYSGNWDKISDGGYFFKIKFMKNPCKNYNDYYTTKIYHVITAWWLWEAKVLLLSMHHAIKEWRWAIGIQLHLFWTQVLEERVLSIPFVCWASDKCSEEKNFNTLTENRMQSLYEPSCHDLCIMKEWKSHWHCGGSLKSCKERSYR